HSEARLGVPTFYWADRDASPALVKTGITAEQAARRYLFANASLYRLSSAQLAEAALDEVHDIGKGGIIATFHKVDGGVPVFRDRIHVLMDRDFRLVAITGYLTPYKWNAAKDPFQLAHPTAIASALADLTGARVEPSQLRDTGRVQNDWRYFMLEGV